MQAVSGTFVKFDAVPTRKVVRITVEAPIENADSILRSLGGFPDPSNAKWVGIAPLTGQPTQQTLKGGGLSANASMLCNDAGFRRFAELKYSKQPRDAILDYCGVTSRAHLDHDDEAATHFRRMKQEFETWRGGPPA